jgi:hypothetical protein
VGSLIFLLGRAQEKGREEIKLGEPISTNLETMGTSLETIIK